MRDDLQWDICEKCGEVHKEEGNIGIWARMNNSCYSNHSTYRMMTGRAGMELLRAAIGIPNRDPFEGLLEFEHLKAMPNYKEASWLERNCFSLARDMEIKQLKRMKAYLQLEEEMMYKY